MASHQHFCCKSSPERAFISKIFPELSGQAALSVNGFKQLLVVLLDSFSVSLFILCTFQISYIKYSAMFCGKV